ISICFIFVFFFFFFFSSRRRHTRFDCDWSSDVCSSDLFLHAPLSARLELRRECGISRKYFPDLCRMIRARDFFRFTCQTANAPRSEERRVGKECRCRWWGEWAKKHSEDVGYGANVTHQM